MTFKTMMSGYSIIAIPMGMACMLAPTPMLANYEVPLPPLGLVINQFWGVDPV